jgi:spore maturation protein CgeB
MFSSEEEFFDKAIYYLEHEEERMKIVNQAYSHFINFQTWKHRAMKILNIINQYIE